MAEEKSGFLERVGRIKRSRTLVLFIVYVALFCDNMLLTVVVPIIPDFLFRQEFANYRPPENSSVSVYNYNPHDHHHGGHLVRYTRTIHDWSRYSKPLVASDHHPKEAIVKTTPKPKEHVKHKKKHRWELRRRPQQRRGLESLSDTEYEQLLGEYMKNQNVALGIMFASNGIAQICTNLLLGPITQRIGFSIPLFFGFIVLVISTVVFAFSTSYGMLFVARCIQGVGSACNSSAGMAWLAYTYTEDDERGKVMGIALGGTALGVLLGPVYGGIVYEHFGKETPFLVIAILAVMDGALQVFALQPNITPAPKGSSNLMTLVKDPYIFIACGALFMGSLCLVMLDPTLPLWMIQTMRASPTQQGLAFLPSALAFVIGSNIFGYLGGRLGRWLMSLIGLFVYGVAFVMLPFSTEFWHLIFPMAIVGGASAMSDACMMPKLGLLVDKRHGSAYGNVYSLADIFISLGYAAGPALGGPLAGFISFEWTCRLFGALLILYSPLLLFLRRAPRVNPTHMVRLQDPPHPTFATVPVNTLGTRYNIVPPKTYTTDLNAATNPTSNYGATDEQNNKTQ